MLFIKDNFYKNISIASTFTDSLHISCQTCNYKAWFYLNAGRAR